MEWQRLTFWNSPDRGGVRVEWNIGADSPMYYIMLGPNEEFMLDSKSSLLQEINSLNYHKPTALVSEKMRNLWGLAGFVVNVNDIRNGKDIRWYYGDGPKESYESKETTAKIAREVYLKTLPLFGEF